MALTKKQKADLAVLINHEGYNNLDTAIVAHYLKLYPELWAELDLDEFDENTIYVLSKPNKKRYVTLLGSACQADESDIERGDWVRWWWD